MTMARSIARGVVLLALSVTIPLATTLAETVERTVRGTVEAVNLAVVPQTIVVTVPLANKEELIVGARVPSDTTITRGKRPARLADIEPGAPVEMRYLKSPDGLIARSIHVP